MQPNIARFDSKIYLFKDNLDEKRTADRIMRKKQLHERMKNLKVMKVDEKIR